MIKEWKIQKVDKTLVDGAGTTCQDVSDFLAARNFALDFDVTELRAELNSDYACAVASLFKYMETHASSFEEDPDYVFREPPKVGYDLPTESAYFIFETRDCDGLDVALIASETGIRGLGSGLSATQD